MPKTKFQDLIFTVIMVLTMVYFMTLYNMASESAFTYSTFLDAGKNMWLEAAAAFVAQRYLAGPAVRKIAARLLGSGDVRPVFMTLVMAGCTVSFMAPMMTLFVTILHNGPAWNLPLLWLPRLVMNFPFALCLQVFYAGPLVRFLFRTLFRKQLSKAPAMVCAAD